jgi:hypothetical protein
MKNIDYTSITVIALLTILHGFMRSMETIDGAYYLAAILSNILFVLAPAFLVMVMTKHLVKWKFEFLFYLLICIVLFIVQGAIHTFTHYCILLK